MKIPQFFATEIPEVPRFSPETATMPYEAGARLGKTISDISLGLLEVRTRIDREKRELNLLYEKAVAESDYRKRFQELVIEKSKAEDKSNFALDIEKDAYKYQQEILNRFARDEDRKKVMTMLNHVHMIEMNKVREKDYQFFMEEKRGFAIKDIYEAKRRIIEAKDEQERLTEKAMAEAKIMSYERYFNKAVTQSQLAEIDATYRKAKEENDIANAIAEIDGGKWEPKEVDEIIKKYDIPAIKKTQLHAHARTMKQNAREEADRMAAINIVNEAKEYAAEWKWDPETYDTVIFGYLNNTEELSKRYTLSQIEQAKMFFRNRWHERKTMDQIRYEKIQLELLHELEDGRLTSERIKTSGLPATGLHQGDQAWFFEKLRQMKIDSDSFLKTKPEVYFNTLKSIVEKPGNWNFNKIMTLVGVKDKDGKPGGLSIKDGTNLWRLWESVSKKEGPFSDEKASMIKLLLRRFEEYRRGFLFTEVKDREKNIATIEETIENDRQHYLVVDQFLKEINQGIDPLKSFEGIMAKYLKPKVQEKLSFWDTLFRIPGMFNIFGEERD